MSVSRYDCRTAIAYDGGASAEYKASSDWIENSVDCAYVCVERRCARGTSSAIGV